MAKSVSRQKTIKSDRKKLCRAVLQAAEAAGKQFGDQGLISYLQAQAVTAPSPFLALLSKVLVSDEDTVQPPVMRVEIVAPQSDAGESGNT